MGLPIKRIAMRNLLILVLLICSAVAFGQSNELVGTFSVVSATGSDPSPIVTGNFNSTVGFLPSAVDTGDILLVRQVYAGNHRRKLYRITGILPGSNSPLVLTLSLMSGTTGGPFPPGTHEILRRTAKGALLDVPNTSQELESYTYNYNTQHFEDADVDTTYVRNDSTFVALNDGTEYFTGKGTAGAITSFQVGDSVYIVYNPDTIFTGVAYNNAGIDTIYLSGGSYYMVTTENDTFLIGEAAQVTLNGAHPVNPPTYLMHVDTLGVDTVYFDNGGVWVRFNVGGSSIGAALFYTLNANHTLFHPSGIPPMGSLVLNNFLGCFERKTSPTVYSTITLPNGRNVDAFHRHDQNDSLSLWDMRKYTKTLLGILGTIGRVNTPLQFFSSLEGVTVVVEVVNGTSSPVQIAWDTVYTDVNNNWLDTTTLAGDARIIYEFLVKLDDVVEYGNKFIQVSDRPGGGTTYVFQDSANGLDLNESAGTVTVAPDVTELVYAAVVGADSLMMWDASANLHRRTSVADVVALAAAGTVTVTDQANGLDITLTGSDITIAPDITELANTVVASTDSVMVWDSDINQHRRVSAGSIAALFTGGLTGVTDQVNGLDITTSGNNVLIAPDFEEVPVASAYNSLDKILVRRFASGTYEAYTWSGLSGGYVDLISNQLSIAGVKGFATGLQWGTGTMPTGVPFGSANQTAFGLKGGVAAFLSESVWQDYGGLIIENNWNSGTGFQTTRMIATGNDSGQDGSYFEIWTRPNGAGVNTVKNVRFASDGANTIAYFGTSNGAGAGVVNVPVGGIGWDGGGANYRLSPVTAGGLQMYENGNVNTELLVGQNDWVSGSDSLLKNTIVPITLTQAQIRAFKAYTYKLNRSDSTQIGVIANQFRADFPEALGNQYADTLSIYYSSVAALALGATANLQVQIDSLVTGKAMSTVAAANDLTLSATRTSFIISGNTQINAITTSGRRAGAEITLIFTGTPTVKHNTVGAGGTAPFRLSGSVDLVAAANTVLTVIYDGTSFQEKSRKIP